LGSLSRRLHGASLSRKTCCEKSAAAATASAAGCASYLAAIAGAARASKHHVGAVVCSATVTLWGGPFRRPLSTGAERPLVKKSALNPTRKMKVTYRVNIKPRSHMSAERPSGRNPQIAFNSERKIAFILMFSRQIGHRQQ